jgi:hypothetical protein
MPPEFVHEKRRRVRRSEGHARSAMSSLNVLANGPSNNTPTMSYRHRLTPVPNEHTERCSTGAVGGAYDARPWVPPGARGSRQIDGYGIDTTVGPPVQNEPSRAADVTSRVPVGQPRMRAIRTGRHRPKVPVDGRPSRCPWPPGTLRSVGKWRSAGSRRWPPPGRSSWPPTGKPL